MKNPFYHRGYIGPERPEAWSIMHWHEEILDKIFSEDFGRDPPEYVEIVAPAQGGKTTLVRQIKQRVAERPAAAFLVVSLDVGALGDAATEQSFSRALLIAFQEQLSEAWVHNPLNSDVMAEVSSQFQAAVPATLDELTECLHSLLPRLYMYDKVVLLIDEFETLPDILANSVLRVLRALHQRRTRGAFRKFSVVLLTARPLLYRSLGGTSPFNIAKTYRIPDIDRLQLARLLRSAGQFLGCLQFTDVAIDYLFKQTAGHLVLVQRICTEIVELTLPKETATGFSRQLGVTDVLDGIAACFEERDKFISTLIDDASLEATSYNILEHLMKGETVLPFTISQRIAQLADRGIVRRCPYSNRLVFRSPLLKTLCIRWVLDEDLFQVVPSLTETERCLLSLPQVIEFIINSSVADEVRSAFKPRSAESADHWMATYQSQAFIFLAEREYEIDLMAAQHFYARYFPEVQPAQIGREMIYRLASKIFAFQALPNAV